MRILLDTCVWGGTVTDLRFAGHDVVWVGDWSEDPGDEEILEIAVKRRAYLGYAGQGFR
jgi:predicted nuclease of predicted toxin-antitoxin system